MVKVSASRTKDPVFESRLRRDFSGDESYQWLKLGTRVATLPGTWRYRVSAGTGWPCVSILWLDEMESLICNFYLRAATRKIVWADPSLRYTRALQPTKRPWSGELQTDASRQGMEAFQWGSGSSWHYGLRGSFAHLENGTLNTVTHPDDRTSLHGETSPRQSLVIRRNAHTIAGHGFTSRQYWSYTSETRRNIFWQSVNKRHDHMDRV